MNKIKFVENIKKYLRYTIKNGKKKIRDNKKVNELSMGEYVDKMVDDNLKGTVALFSLTGRLDLVNLREKTELIVDRVMEIVETDVEKIQSLYDALTIDGFNKVTYGLPRLMVTCMSNSSFFARLILSGIKINGEATEFNLKLMDVNEIKLKGLERQMALLINDNLDISPSNLNAFMGLYKEYFITYVKKIIDEKIIEFNPPEDLYNITILTMRNYIRFGYIEDDEVIDSIDNYVIDGEIVKMCPLDKFKELLEQSTLGDKDRQLLIDAMTMVINSEEELKKYIANGKIVVACDLDYFKELLSNTLIPEFKQQEYLVQMQNLIRRNEQEAKNIKIEELKQSILSNQDIELYKKAKYSGNIEATQILKEIDALLELLFEVADEEEKASLVSECELYFGYLNDLFKPKTHEKVEVPNILYYKDKDMVPLIFGGIQRCLKSEYKQIYSDIIKILKGNVGNDPFIKDNHSPIPVYVKGKKFKIFYLVINGVTLIIYGGSATDGYKNVLNILRGKEFKNYLGYLQANLNEELLANEASYNELVLNELKKSERVRKLATLS